MTKIDYTIRALNAASNLLEQDNRIKNKAIVKSIRDRVLYAVNNQQNLITIVLPRDEFLNSKILLAQQLKY